MSDINVVVIGSINMDLVTETRRIPKLGETIIGQRFSTVAGGKGANQAVACARLGANVTFVGCVGDDIFGKKLIHNLNHEKVITDHVETVRDVATGIASITIKDGANSIIVVPGANSYLTPDKIKKVEPVIKEANIILLQMEIPLETVQAAVDIAYRHGVPIVLNPAPAVKLPKALIEKVTVLTPNEHELPVILGKEPERTVDLQSLLKLYQGKIVMTKGRKGAYLVNDHGEINHIPSYDVDVVDTTGAGDSFNAGLVMMLCQGKSIIEATRYAVAVGALSVTKFGAQGGMPSKQEVDDFINKNRMNSF